MDFLETITLKGLTVSKQNGLLDLPEIYQIPFDEEKTKEFIQIQITDLFEFSTLEQFFSYENLFLRAFNYSYGKGFEFALSYMIGEPLERIGYDFDECMNGNGLTAVPEKFAEIAQTHLYILREIFTEMFEMTKGSQSKLIDAGITFPDCVIKILNGAFFLGRRVAVSCDLQNYGAIHLKSDISDKKYDYDSYDQRYDI